MHYECIALPTELRKRDCLIIARQGTFVKSNFKPKTDGHFRAFKLNPLLTIVTFLCYDIVDLDILKARILPR